MIRFIRWSSSRDPKKPASRETNRNRSKWHLIADGSRITFCGRAVHASSAPVKPEYETPEYVPLRLPPGADEDRGICRRCAESHALWAYLKGVGDE